MNRIYVLVTALIVTALIAVLPLAYVAVTGDFTALVHRTTGLEEDSAVIDMIFTARETFSL